MLCASAYTFAYKLARGCAYALIFVQFFHLALGKEDGEIQLVYNGTCCLAWGAIFDRWKDTGVVCVLSIFDTMCVYVHTHIHTTDGVLGCEPRGRDETPGGPGESR